MMMKKTILEQDSVCGVPLIFCAPAEPKKLPLVFFIHGYSGDKRSGLELAYNLAERDIATICLDAAMHGGRLDYRVATTWDGPQKGDMFPYETGLDRYLLIMKVITETVKDLHALVDFYRDDQRVDLERLGICGTSMGGFIAYCFAAQEPSVKVLTTLISFPSLLQRWQDVLVEATSQPSLAEHMMAVTSEAELRTKEVAELDPIAGLRHFAPKPLLMVCGDLDTDTHKSYSLRFYEQMKEVYGDRQGNLQYRVHPNAVHRVTSAMVNDAVDWFARHL
jgi:cephalosporin-C deacetylase-like acetyl esterase